MDTSKRFLSALAALLLLLTSCGPRRPPPTVRTAADIAGSTIGVLSGSAASVYAATYGQIKEYSTEDAMLADLYSGALDCAVADGRAVPSLLKSSRGIRALDEPLISVELCIAAAKESRDMTADMNAALQALRESKIPDSLINKYILGGSYDYIPRSDIPDDAGSLRLAARGDLPPYGVSDGERVTGLDIDIARAVCDMLGVKLEIIETAPEELVASVWSGHADFGMGGLYKTAELETLVDFSEPYASLELRVLTRK
jgi:ABC-type amino acid transport substrate-binding protein